MKISEFMIAAACPFCGGRYRAYVGMKEDPESLAQGSPVTIPTPRTGYGIVCDRQSALHVIYVCSACDAVWV